MRPLVDGPWEGEGGQVPGWGVGVVPPVCEWVGAAAPHGFEGGHALGVAGLKTKAKSCQYNCDSIRAVRIESIS